MRGKLANIIHHPGEAPHPLNALWFGHVQNCFNYIQVSLYPVSTGFMSRNFTSFIPNSHFSFRVRLHTACCRDWFDLCQTPRCHLHDTVSLVCLQRSGRFSAESVWVLRKFQTIPPKRSVVKGSVLVQGNLLGIPFWEYYCSSSFASVSSAAGSMCLATHSHWSLSDHDVSIVLWDYHHPHTILCQLLDLLDGTNVFQSLELWLDFIHKG